MRHYVVVFLESQLFPGTWVTDHFIRREEREDIADLPDTLLSVKHPLALKLLADWQNEEAPSPSWTLEECFLGEVGRFTVLWYGRKDTTLSRIFTYRVNLLR